MRTLATTRLADLELTDLSFTVPLDHTAPGRTIEVFARAVVASEQAANDLPWLVFLQGGPGSAAPRPTGSSGWLGAALERYRVLLLDQRGTGRSSPVDAASLIRIGEAHAQAEYLACFRADAIVMDAELVRRELVGDAPWTVLGQSFGGFCAFSYLSSCPEGLEAAIVTGGIPPIGVLLDDVYRATYRRVLERNLRYFDRYPEDADLIRRIVDRLDAHDVRLPAGARCTPEVLQLLGLNFGFSDGFETVHYLVEGAFGDDGGLSYNFLRRVDHALTFETNPIFSVLHEAAYCEGVASRWSAARTRDEFPELDPRGEGPVRFTGEMIYPWKFDVFPQLKPFKEAAELLASRSDWGPLYDPERLAANTVPVVAAIYAQDMFVERSFSEDVAGSVPNLTTWLTPDWDHDGLRADPQATVLRQLLAMLDERKRSP